MFLEGCENPGTVRLTWDDFFETNRKKFDVILIDAPHDMMPINWKHEHMPRIKLGWMGDVWNVAVEVAATEGLDFRLVLIDHGVGVLQAAPDAAPLVDMESELLHQRFGGLYENIHRLLLCEWDEAVAWIDERLRK